MPRYAVPRHPTYSSCSSLSSCLWKVAEMSLAQPAFWLWQCPCKLIKREFLQRRKSPNPSEHKPKSGFLPKMLRLRTEVLNAVMRQLRPVWLRWKLRRGFTRVCNVVARFPKVVSVKHSWLTLLCWPCIQACKISTVLGNPRSLLRMSLCYATLSAVRQSATKPPVSGPFKPTSGLTTDWPGASVPPFVSNTLMRAVKLSKFTPVALRHEQ